MQKAITQQKDIFYQNFTQNILNILYQLPLATKCLEISLLQFFSALIHKMQQLKTTTFFLNFHRVTYVSAIN